MTPLHDTLRALPDEPWTALRQRLHALTVHIPGPNAPRSEQVEELVRAAERQLRLPEVQAELDRVRRFFAGGRGEVEAWLASRREQLGEVQVLGLFVDDTQSRIPIEEIYVDLDMVRADPGRMGGDHLFQPRESALDAARTLDAALAALPAAGKRGLVLVGLPGSGKTTLVQRAWCREHDARSADPARRLPLLVRCATLQHLGTAGLGPRDLRRVVEAEAAAEGFPGAGEALLDGHRGPLLVMLDGLDELKDADDRARVADWVTAEVTRWPASTWVVTTRRATWGAEERRRLGERLVPFELLNLTEPSVDAYVRAWFPLMARVDAAFAAEGQRARVEEEAKLAADRLVALLARDRAGRDQHRVRRLTGNPLTLSIVCLVYRRFHELPRGRGRLYGYCLETLLRGRYRPGQPPEFDREQGTRLLRGLAWAMQAAAESADSPKELPRDEVLAALDDARLAVPALAEVPAEELLRRLHAECGVLYTADHERFQFAHLTLQEYLATEQARAKNWGKELAARAGEPRWREPILLAMAEPGLQRAFWEAVLAEGVATHAALLADCVAEADPDPEPFVDWLRRPDARPADLVAVLGLFGESASPAIRAAAARLADHEDPGVRAQAGRFGARGPVTGARPPDPRPGQRWRCGPLDMDFVWVPPGRFWMGAARTGSRNVDPEAWEDEAPVDEVVIPRGFWLGRFPVTNAQYRAFVTDTGAREPEAFRTPGFDAPDQPVTSVDWEEARAWAAWAGARAGAGVELPTEAEWEWAARGDDGRRYPWGDAPPSLDRAWYGAWRWDEKASKWVKEGAEQPEVSGPAPVGGRPAGAGPFGAEEQVGNVWEWCADAWSTYDKPGQQDDTLRVVRGGSWFDVAWWLRAAVRFRVRTRDRFDNLGFRVVLRPPER